MLGINYPTSPDVTFTYNEINKVSTMTTVGLGTSTFTYTDAENAAGESGLWASDAVGYGYHATAPGLRTGLTITQPSGSWAQTYGFDSARRLQTVAAPSGSFTYTYKGPGTVWTNLALPNMSAITNLFDSGGRLTATRLKNNAGTILNKHDYLYNGGGQRQRNTLTDGSYTTYSYDNDAQLSSSLGYTSGGTPVTSQQLGFGYDAGWNMTSRSVNGSPATYTVNDRNQLTVMTGPDYFTNDVNGNLTYWGSQSGWQRNLSYDDENRLVGVTVPGYYIGSYVYDGLSRLRVRTEQRWNGSVWVNTTVRYLYDGMNIVQERDGSNVPQVTYTRGKDLSGTLEGAGGIGGLLARSHGYSGGNWSTHNFYHADALGNVTYLVSSAQAMAANYRYDPYGRTISSGGTLASANVYRFSSKLAMDVSAMTLYYYGFRFYDADLQRWINRDPIGERGGINLYGFVGNEPTDAVDRSGLDIWIVVFPGLFQHHGIIGDGGGGRYWYSDFGPVAGAAFYTQGKFGYIPKYSSPNDLPYGLTVACRIKTSPDVDKLLEQKAVTDSNATQPPNYFCLGNNCITYLGEFEALAGQLMNPISSSSKVNAPPVVVVTR